MMLLRRDRPWIDWLIDWRSGGIPIAVPETAHPNDPRHQPSDSDHTPDGLTAPPRTRVPLMYTELLDIVSRRDTDAVYPQDQLATPTHRAVHP